MTKAVKLFLPIVVLVIVVIVLTLLVRQGVIGGVLSPERPGTVITTATTQILPLE